MEMFDFSDEVSYKTGGDTITIKIFGHQISGIVKQKNCKIINGECTLSTNGSVTIGINNKKYVVPREHIAEVSAIFIEYKLRKDEYLPGDY
jgi:hypothetical protein